MPVVNTIFQIRNDTTTNWTSLNPVLAVGEFGYDTVLKQHKIGDGITHWNSLAWDTAGAQGPQGAAGNGGSTTITWGTSYAGANEASVVVSAPTILSTSIPVAQYSAVASTTNTISDHTYAALISQLSCSAPTASVGFTIYGTSLEKLNGTFNINYHWV